MRDHFRGAGYDHPHGSFGNEAVIMDALGRTVAGTIGGQVLWEILQGGYSTRGPSGRPDFVRSVPGRGVNAGPPSETSVWPSRTR